MIITRTHLEYLFGGGTDYQNGMKIRELDQ